MAALRAVRPGEAVRRRIVLVVGLGLDDDAADAVDEDTRADQRTGDVDRVGAKVDAASVGPARLCSAPWQLRG